MITTNMLVFKSILSIVIPIIIILLVWKIYKNKKNGDISTSTEKSNSLINKPIKLVLIVVFIIILAGLMISLNIASNSQLKQATIPNENIVSNSSIENKENEQQKQYDFLDNENSTFKFTEKEAIEKLTKMMNSNINEYEKSRGKDGKTIMYTKVDYAGILSIGIKSSDMNNKVTDISVSYVASSYISDELLLEMVSKTTARFNAIILQVDVNDFISGDLSESENKKAEELKDLILKKEAIDMSFDYGGEGKVSSMSVKYSVIQ